VLSTIRYLFKVDVSLNTVFESPTVASLAREVIAKETKPGQAEKIAKILKKIGNMSTEDVGGALQEKREERANR
jgi:cell division inhibitor SulA